ncbi:MAG: hypothetical protein Q9174_007254, partial [Haloplaca sp. 1 TL-2023]
FFWGPLSFCTALMITYQHPLRHPFQALVSIGQIYGDILYYATSMFDHYYKGITYCRPEAYYFWGYYGFMNFIWIVIPGCESRLPLPLAFARTDHKTNVRVDLLYESFKVTAQAFAALEKQSKGGQGNGYVKKRN